MSRPRKNTASRVRHFVNHRTTGEPSGNAHQRRVARRARTLVVTKVDVEERIITIEGLSSKYKKAKREAA